MLLHNNCVSVESTCSMLNWLKYCHLLSPNRCATSPPLLTPHIFFIQPSATLWWLFSQPVGVERPSCGLILLCRRAVNTHFCGCQFGEGGQPCGTQHSISSIPSSRNKAGFRLQKTFFSLSFPLSGNNVIASKPDTYWLCGFLLLLIEGTCS